MVTVLVKNKTKQNSTLSAGQCRIISFSWVWSALFVTHRSRQQIASIHTKTSCVWILGTVSTMHMGHNIYPYAQRDKF